MKKILAILASVFVVSGMSAAVVGAGHGNGDAQITEAPGDQYQPDSPGEQPDNPGSNPGQGERQGGPAGNLPDLPKQASDTAQQVIDTIGGVTDRAGGAIGQALQSLLGAEQTSLDDTDQGTEEEGTEAA